MRPIVAGFLGSYPDSGGKISVPIGEGETPRVEAKRRSPKSRRDSRVIFKSS